MREDSSTTIDLPPPAVVARPRGWRWWLRALEVRLRFVLLVFAILVVTTQWSRLRSAWDDLRQRLWGDARDLAVSGDMEYFCPMDPGVISVWPAICPICNMDLVQRQKHDAQILPEGVIARMQLSPYRVQLAGIRTADVRTRELVEEVPVVGTLRQPAGPDAPLELQARLSQIDRRRLTEPQTVVLRPLDDSSPAVEMRLLPLADAGDAPGTSFQLELDGEAPAWLTAGATVRGNVQIPAVSSSEMNSDQALLAIPESAVVDHGTRQLVFVESMPGMFDAREVTLGQRCGDFYPVLRGLQEGERIAEAGAFLIDAETRLNPSLAVAYFGANQANTSTRTPQIKFAEERPAKKKLSPEDESLAKAQVNCPVTGLALDSMGGPVPVTVQGRKVFICCEGCEGKLKGDPEKYFAKLPQP